MADSDPGKPHKIPGIATVGPVSCLKHVLQPFFASHRPIEPKHSAAALKKPSRTTPDHSTLITPHMLHPKLLSPVWKKALRGGHVDGAARRRAHLPAGHLRGITCSGFQRDLLDFSVPRDDVQSSTLHRPDPQTLNPEASTYSLPEASPYVNPRPPAIPVRARAPQYDPWEHRRWPWPWECRWHLALGFGFRDSLVWGVGSAFSFVGSGA